MKEYAFTSSIKEILKSHFREKVEDIYDKSPLLQYVNLPKESQVHDLLSSYHR